MYHAGDFTRGVLAWATSNESWKRNADTYAFGSITKAIFAGGPSQNTTGIRGKS
jgi:hypothetical protein